MEYIIAKNAEFGSLEVAFPGKPSEAVRDALKALRFRWHSKKRVWYGYSDEETLRAALNGEAPTKAEAPCSAAAKTAPANKYGVKVGDIFHASWGYEQTNNDFFQVVALVGSSSVRVVEVNPPIIERIGVSGMSEDRVYKITRELLPPSSSSVFIKDQEKGDLKRLRSYADDGVSAPQFKLASFADAYYCPGETLKAYESWYY